MTPEQEVRAATICCPSCGSNLADLIRNDHRMALVVTGDWPHVGFAECRDGQRVQLDDLDKVRAAYNLVLAEGWLWDAVDAATPLAGRSPLSMDFPASYATIPVAATSGGAHTVLLLRVSLEYPWRIAAAFRPRSP